MQRVRPIYDAIHILHGKRHAGQLVIFKNRHVDHHGAFTGKNFRQPDVRHANDFLLCFKPRHIAAKAADFAAIGIDLQTARFKVTRVAIPHNNIARAHARLLQPFANSLHQHRMGRDSLAAQPVHLDTDHSVLVNIWETRSGSMPPSVCAARNSW